MNALKILITPPSTSSASPYTAHPEETDASSELSDLGTIPESQSDTSTEGAPRDSGKPLPPIPPKDARRPTPLRRNNDTTGSESLRPADDLLTQVDMLRASANAARSRRPNFRGNRRRTPAYERRSEELHGRRASRRSASSTTPSLHTREAETRSGTEAAQLVIDARSPNRTAKSNVLLVDPVHTDGGPDDARRLQIRYWFDESSSSSESWGSEKYTRKRARLLRAPITFFRRFCCLSHFDCTKQMHIVEVHESRQVNRAVSITSNSACFDDLMRSEPTRRLHLNPRSSLISSSVIEVR